MKIIRAWASKSIIDVVKNNCRRRRRSSATTTINDDDSIEEASVICPSNPTNCRNLVHIETPCGKPIREVYNRVDDGEILGFGMTGIVRKIEHKKTGIQYALKQLKLKKEDKESVDRYQQRVQQFQNEISIMRELDHPNIVPLKEVYISHDEIFLVQELCQGGDLFEGIGKQPNQQYTEQQCARLVKQMLRSVQYLHSKGIMHRDLKLENFILSSNDANAELKMLDFGFAKRFKSGEVQHEVMGTLYTIAPEVCLGEYDERCDMWSIGVITYMLLSGSSPFGGCTRSQYGRDSVLELRDKLVNGTYNFEEKVWDDISDQAKDFIGRLLVADPDRRLTAQEAQRSPWLQKWAVDANCNPTMNSILSPSIAKALVKFKKLSKMRQLLCKVLSFTLLPEQLEDLRREFEKLDLDGSGEISLANFRTVLIQNAESGNLGPIVTEREIEDIFHALHICDSDSHKIQWHEFVAAGLSQCKLDDRNLCLAFDMIDKLDTGSISFQNVVEALKSSGVLSQQAIQRMCGSTLMNSRLMNEKISYGKFRLLMKGKTGMGLLLPNLHQRFSQRLSIR